MDMHFDPRIRRFGSGNTNKNTLKYKNISPYYLDLLKSHIEANNHMLKNIHIYINKNIVLDVSTLADELDKRLPNNDLRILDGVIRALKLSVSTEIEQSEKPYRFELELIKLVPKIDERSDLIDFYNEQNDSKAFEILRKMEAVKRDYDSPIRDYIKQPGHPGRTDSDIFGCIRSWFGENIEKALNSNIIIFFGAERLTSFHDFSLKLKEYGLENDGKTFRLMNRSLKAVLGKRGEIEPARNIYFDLLKLMPGKLANKKVNNKDVEDTIDAIDYNVVIHFLGKIKAIEW